MGGWESRGRCATERKEEERHGQEGIVGRERRGGKEKEGREKERGREGD